MGVIRHADAIDVNTGEPLTGEGMAGLSRCLAVLTACSSAIETLTRNAAAPKSEAGLASSADAVHALLLSITNICSDGEQLRRDTADLAKAFGGEIMIVRASDLKNTH